MFMLFIYHTYCYASLNTLNVSSINAQYLSLSCEVYHMFLHNYSVLLHLTVDFYTVDNYTSHVIYSN